jgi:hypothetical protein
MEEAKKTPGFGECFTSLALGMAPFILLIHGPAIFGTEMIEFQGESQTGFEALLSAIIIDLVLAVSVAGLQQLGFIFLRLIGRIRTQLIRRAGTKA